MTSKQVKNREERSAKVFALSPEEQIELKFRHYSALSFIVIVLVCGLPLWWFTTATYRAPLKDFSANQEMVIPVYVSIATFNQSACGQFEFDNVIVSLIDMVKDLPEIDQLSMNFVFHRQILDSIDEINDSSTDDDRFIMRIVIIEKNDWKIAGKTIYFGPKSWIYLLNDCDADKLLQRIYTSLVDIMLDRAHLSIIVKRDLKHRTDPLEIMSLPPNEQKRFVWDSVALRAEYIVQIIFAHTSPDETFKNFNSTNVILNVRRFAKKIEEVTKLHISSEHLWDFDIDLLIAHSDSAERIIDVEALSKIIIQVDQDTSTVESSAPLLKLVIIDHPRPLILLDQQGTVAKSMSIASWGAVIAYNDEKTSESIISALRILFGIDSELPEQSFRHPSPLTEWELNRLKLRSYVDSTMNGISYVRTMHKLVAEIDNIVISDQVASIVDEAVSCISEALSLAEKTGQLDVAKAVKGRRLAEEAINDHSLIALLYFPSDQKFAVYLPLFLPILLPFVGSFISLYNHFIKKSK